jgi:hypothetical protein
MEQPRYYPTQPVAVTERMARQIWGAVREVDAAQAAVGMRLSQRQRVRQAASMIGTAQRAAAHHLHQRHPELSEQEALHTLRSIGIIGYARSKRRQARQEPSGERR